MTTGRIECDSGTIPDIIRALYPYKEIRDRIMIRAPEWATTFLK